MCLIALYVDDLVIAGSNAAIVNRVKNQLKENYKMKDLGVINHILGCEARHDEETSTTYLTQYQFAKAAIEKFLPDGTNPCETPSNPTIVLSRDMSPKTPQEKGETSKYPYREAVGTLLWLSLGTRPDISYAVSQVAKFNDCYGEEHWNAVKRIFRYLKGTVKLGLKFCSSEKSKDFLKRFNSLNYLSSRDEISLKHNAESIIELLCMLLGFVDSDHGRDIDTRRAITGFIFFLGFCPISWQSKQQTSVALSSMEAEYMAACAPAQETIWLSRLLKEFCSHFINPIILLEDNQACIHLSKNPGDHSKPKHIDTRYHFVREQVEKGAIVLEKVDTNDNLADIFTKPLANAQFHAITSQFMTFVY